MTPPSVDSILIGGTDRLYLLPEEPFTIEVVAGSFERAGRPVDLPDQFIMDPGTDLNHYLRISSRHAQVLPPT